MWEIAHFGQVVLGHYFQMLHVILPEKFLCFNGELVNFFPNDDNTSKKYRLLERKSSKTKYSVLSAKNVMVVLQLLQLLQK